MKYDKRRSEAFDLYDFFHNLHNDLKLKKTQTCMSSSAPKLNFKAKIHCILEQAKNIHVGDNNASVKLTLNDVNLKL